MTSEHLPPAVTAELRRLTGGELTPVSRLGYLALLLAASAMTVVVGSLWMTEAALPPRTSVAMGALIVIGLSWVIFAAWVLARRPLLAQHRVVAGWMSVAFTALFAIGAAAASYATEARAADLAAATGVAMLGIAVVLLVRARRAVAGLVARREALERELGKRGGHR